MFYKSRVESHIRIPPSELKRDTKAAVLEKLSEQFEGHISPDVGFVISVLKIEDIGEGIIIPGDGAAYYKTIFEVITFKPELQEIVYGKISDIANFGAFINIGPIEGMIHISQTMDDFVSFSKQGILTGKESKHTIKVNDKCKARIIAVSFKEITNPKINLTMRQPGLGALQYLEEKTKKKSK